jgi:hypothetical protein
VKWIDEVLEHALQYQPTPLSDEKESAQKKESSKEDKDQSGDETHINTH